jgi:hypothetical protein
MDLRLDGRANMRPSAGFFNVWHAAPELAAM